MSPLDHFAQSLRRPDLPDWIASGLIGDNVLIEGPYGHKRLVYADYVASGRPLAQVEDFIRDHVLPYYANTHTEASFCGSYMTQLRAAARARIAASVGATEDSSVIFSGAGATSGINQIARLLDLAGLVRSGGRAVVLIGPYEHHSNILPWRETGAEVIEIDEAAMGGPDLQHLEEVLHATQGADLLIGAFSAASNVTGIITDVDAVTRTLKRHGALAIWDYGCAGPYLPMRMNAGSDAAKDAIIFSTHKFIGGPGGSGVLVLRDAIVRRRIPTRPGGGTVGFVSPWRHDYAQRLHTREEGGTPNVLGDIRAALAVMVKDALGCEWLGPRQDVLARRARAAWADHPRIDLLGTAPVTARLPILSFRVRDAAEGFVHHQLFTRMLSDRYGIQARGGCACAGSYAHRLLGLDGAASDALHAAIAAGDELAKPGWVRLNLSALMQDDKVQFILDSVAELAWQADTVAADYTADPATARFTPRRAAA